MTLEAKYSIEANIMSAIQNLIPEGFSFSFSLFHQSQNITQSQIAEQIQTIVLQYFEMSKEQLLSKGKAGKKPLVRKFICKFLRQYTTLSLKAISTFTHPKEDHSTVIDSIDVLNNWLQVDEEIITMHNELNHFILSQIKY